MGGPQVSGILMDTHCAVWLMEGSRRMGPRARDTAEQAGHDDRLFVSAITFWEVAMLSVRGKITLHHPVAEWRHRVLDLGIVEAPVSGDIGIAAVGLPDFPLDPADRMITATALLCGLDLMTADSGILGWPGVLERHDARA